MTNRGRRNTAWATSFLYIDSAHDSPSSTARTDLSVVSPLSKDAVEILPWTQRRSPTLLSLPPAAWLPSRSLHAVRGATSFIFIPTAFQEKPRPSENKTDGADATAKELADIEKEEENDLNKPPKAPKFSNIGPSPPEAYSTQMHIDTIAGGPGRAGERAKFLHQMEQEHTQSTIMGISLFVLWAGTCGEYLVAKMYRKLNGLPRTPEKREKKTSTTSGKGEPAADRSAGRPIDEEG